MAVTNFLVSSLPAYVQENRDLLIKNFALVGTATRTRIGLQTGIKKSAYLNYLNVEPTLQDGSACGFNALGEVSLTQREIEVAIIKVDLDICAKNLIGKWAEYLVRVNGDQSSLPFEQYVMDGLVAEINKKIEKLIWQGDKTLTTNPNLKWIDGLLTQFAADTDVVKEAIAAGTSAYDAILAVYMALPEEVLDRNAVIFVSPATYREFVQDLVNKNFYHYSGPQDAAPEEFIFPGTDVRVVKAPGLAGTAKPKLVGTWADNLVYGTDMENDNEDIYIEYERKSQVFHLTAAWASGIAYYFPQFIVEGTIG